MKINTELSAVMAQYRKCTNYNLHMDYYAKTAQHKDFYIGDQWKGVNAPDLDKPVLNFIRRVCSFLAAMVASQDIQVFVNPYVHTEENTRNADVMNIALQQVIETSNLNVMARKAVLDGLVTGDGWLYWYNEEGIIKCDLLKGTNVLFANPYVPDVQKQPFILIEHREYMDTVVEMAEKNRQPVQGIQADKEYSAGLTGLPMVTLITQLYKQDGKVWYTQVTKDCVITPPVCLGGSMYPIAKFTWDSRSDSYHGVGVVENLIPNQIAVNKLWAMALLHQKTMAFPKIFFDKTKLDKWTNRVGAAIGVIGNPHDAVATSFKANDMSNQLMDLVEKTIAYTKEFMGANDTSLGNVNPENTSAILAVQRSATIPLENQKLAFSDFLEDCVMIIMDIISTRWGEKFVQISTESGDTMEKFDYSAIDVSQLSWMVQADNTTPWSESVQMQTLENLYTKQILTDAYDYVQAIPSSQLKNKQRILKKLEEKIQ